jgi:hypothetical protein
VSHGILQHAVTGKVPLQLAYASPEAHSAEAPCAEDQAANQLHQAVEDEFACLLELI